MCYLKPIWSDAGNADADDDADDAKKDDADKMDIVPVSDIRFVKFSKSQKNENYRGDLAKGSGGKYRYIELVRDGKEAIVDIAFFRMSRKEEKEQNNKKPEQYENYSADLNDGRKGDSLYLCFNKQTL